MKKVLNVFGIILAALLSLALVPTLIVTPVWQGVSGLLDPAFIEDAATQIVSELDLSELSLDDTELMAELQNAGISREAAQALLSSETLQQVIEPLGHDFALVLTGSFEALSLTEAQLQQIVTEHRAELVEIIRLMEEDGVQAIIPGEIIEWTTLSYIRDGIAQGKPMACYNIGHFSWEELGMKYAADWIKELVDGQLPVHYVPTGDAFSYL
jgi:hypothetical protein